MTKNNSNAENINDKEKKTIVTDTIANNEQKN